MIAYSFGWLHRDGLLESCAPAKAASDITFTPDGKQVLRSPGERVSKPESGFIRRYDRLTGQAIEPFFDIPQPNVVGSLSFSPDGQYLYGGGGSGRVYCWNANSARLDRIVVSEPGGTIS